MLLGLLLVSMVLGASGETTIDDYLVEITDSSLISVRSTARSSEQLNLSGLGLKRIDRYAFANVTNIKILNLANNSIGALTASVFSSLRNLEHLSLADNDINDFIEAFAGLENLKTLNISNNPIEVLEQGALHGLNKTIDIFVRGNSFTKICTDVFRQVDSSRKFATILSNESVNTSGLYMNYDDPPGRPEDYRIKLCMDQGKVTLLDRMRGNEVLEAGCIWLKLGRTGLHLNALGIKEFEGGWYRVVNYRNMIIGGIYLRGNKIEDLDQFTNYHLVNVSEVRKLDLKDNRIAILRRNSLSGLRNLKVLNLSNNRIRTLEPGCFEDIKNMVALSLRENEIDNIDPGLFEDLPHLNSLDLGQNRLTRITDGFRSLPSNLDTLNLSNNKIGSLENGTFVNVPKKLLNLENNRIKSIAKGTFNVPEDLLIKPAKPISCFALSWFVMSHSYIGYKLGAQLIPTNIKLSGNPIGRLENGALFTFPRDRHNYVDVEGNSIEVIQGGLFDDGYRSTKLLYGNRSSQFFPLPAGPNFCWDKLENYLTRDPISGDDALSTMTR